MPKISVIIPVYKAEKYLNRCIDSVLAQTFSDFELILVNDGSPDNCGAICDNYAQSDSRIRVIHQQNSGQAAARNNGFANSRGEWIHFVDSDDLIHPQILEFLYKAVTKSNSLISMCNMMESDSLPKDFLNIKTFEAQDLHITEDTLFDLWGSGEKYYWVVWGKLIHRDIIEKFPFSEGRIYEDNAIVFRWLIEAEKISIVPLEFYFYQINLDGTTKSEFSIKKLDELWSLEEQLKYYKETNMQKMYSLVVSHYLMIGCAIYNQLKAEKKHKAYAKSLILKLRRFYRNNKLILNLSNEASGYVACAFNPTRVKLKSYIFSFKTTLKREGVLGLIKKVLKKFTRGKK